MANAAGFYRWVVLCFSAFNFQQITAPPPLGYNAIGIYTPAGGYPEYAFMWQRGLVVRQVTLAGANPSKAMAERLAIRQAAYTPSA
jgi:hypothetical protein